MRSSPPLTRRDRSDHPHRRGLAGAVGAEEAERLAPAYVDVDAVDRLERRRSDLRSPRARIIESTHGRSLGHAADVLTRFVGQYGDAVMHTSERRLGLLMLAAAAGTNVPTPLLLVYREQLHMSSTSVTALFGVYALGLMPAVAFAGPAADRWGRRRVALPAALFCALTSLLYVTVAQHEPCCSSCASCRAPAPGRCSRSAARGSSRRRCASAAPRDRGRRRSR